MGDDHIGVEHLLLGLLAEEEDIAASVLAELGVTADGVRRELASRRAPAVFGPAEAEALESISIDLEAIRRRVEASFGAGAAPRLHRHRARPARPDPSRGRAGRRRAARAPGAAGGDPGRRTGEAPQGLVGSGS